jgi:hypothetical protein
MRLSNEWPAWMSGVLLITLAVAGCGAWATRTPVEGVLRVDGKPVPQGLKVVFTPDTKDGEPCVGVTNDKGRYVMYAQPGMKGLPRGRYTVSIPSPVDAIGGSLILPPELADITIPDRYRPGRSTLVCDVRWGGTAYDIDVKSE